MSTYRTPLKEVRGLGSARGGTEHFWVQRLTAAANIIVIAFLVYALISLVGAPRAEVKAFFSHPVAAVLGLLLAISVSIHMRIGMQGIVEDYVHGGLKVLLLLLNTFFSIFIGAATALAVIKLFLGV